jgi:hypothetical protein
VTCSFASNGLNQRVGQTDSAGTASYVLADDSIDAAVLADGAATYTHGATGLIAESRGGTAKFYG